jgi:heme-degrading monooxygenase HmoA
METVQIVAKKDIQNKVSFIDKFFIPKEAKSAFYERMRINRKFIKTLPGFIEDHAYEYTDANGNLICITIAHWESREVLNQAKERVQAEYKKQGFDPGKMFARLNIVVDRGVYTGIE